MTISYWGTRGSLTTNTLDTEIYGGNTSCVAVGSGDVILILDAGSGIVQLGDLLQTHRGRKIHILLTHLHMDHIHGLGFFKPFFDPDATIHLWGPRGRRPLLQRLNKYLSPPLFPVRIRDFNCDLHLHEVPEEAFEIGPFSIQGTFVCHPGPTLGYRITNGVSTLAFIPDHEPALGVRNFPIDAEWTSGYSVAKDVDLLIHDAQFTPHEYEARKGWGHSTHQHAIALATLAGAKQLEFFHHDPTHSDAQLDAILSNLGTDYPFGINLAQEGKSIQLA